MAQVLKDYQRKRIVVSATEEFAKNGIHGSSMRSIAINANMTVGNLYRYFKNKEELALYIIDPVLRLLNNVNSYFSVDNGFLNDQVIIDLNENTLNELLEKWVDNLVEAEALYKKELFIIINDEDINRNYSDRLVEMLKHVLKIINPPHIKSKLDIEFSASMVAKSIFYGLRIGIQMKYENEMDKEDFRAIMKHFIKHSLNPIKP